jgi:hypothetical protein
MDKILTTESIDDGQSTSNTLPEYEWSVEHEKILTEWADKAMCYRWLHAKSNSKYSHLNAVYTIPVIVISTVTGTANFAQTRVPDAYQNYYAMIVGFFNILAGVITTVQQFLKITQLNEAHRVSSIAWDKFYRNIKIELAKHPNERTHVSQMLKMSKEEYDRLMETSPNIPDDIISVFKNSFKDSEDFKKIIKPEICDELISTNLSRNPWFNDENKDKTLQNLAKSRKAIEDKKSQLKTDREKIFNDFNATFFKLNNRDPLESEIINNLSDKIDLDVLMKLIQQFKGAENNV